MDFSTLALPEDDPILKVMLAFRADTRADKIDLGVGVYKDASGATPVMSAVRKAEAALVESQETKAYTTILGDAGFLDAITELVLAGSVSGEQVHACATTGGTQAVRILCDLARLTAPEARLWISDPSWPNHPVIAEAARLPMQRYRYFDPVTRMVDFAGMMADLAEAKPGDIVLLHATCHNPTGADLTLPQWEELVAFLEARSLTPFVDNAYQGFAEGLEEDAAPIRLLAKRLPVLLVAASCSKNFGLYRERAGAALVVCQDTSLGARLRGTLTELARCNYSFPPDHGARVVTNILGDSALRAEWLAELAENRQRVASVRDVLAQALRRESNSDRFDFLAKHRGMFSRLGATPEQVDALRDAHGIYIVGDSRMNMAGLVPDTAERLARAIVSVGI